MILMIPMISLVVGAVIGFIAGLSIGLAIYAYDHFFAQNTILRDIRNLEKDRKKIEGQRNKLRRELTVAENKLTATNLQLKILRKKQKEQTSNELP